MLSHPYPRVANRLRRYASMLSASLCISGSVEEEPPLIVPVLLYNGLPAWVPRSFDRGWNRFEYTFVDVRRLPPEAGGAHGLVAALSCPETAAPVADLKIAPGLALDFVRHPPCGSDREDPTTGAERSGGPFPPIRLYPSSRVATSAHLAVGRHPRRCFARVASIGDAWRSRSNHSGPRTGGAVPYTPASRSSVGTSDAESSAATNIASNAAS